MNQAKDKTARVAFEARKRALSRMVLARKRWLSSTTQEAIDEFGGPGPRAWARAFERDRSEEGLAPLRRLLARDPQIASLWFGANTLACELLWGIGDVAGGWLARSAMERPLGDALSKAWESSLAAWSGRLWKAWPQARGGGSEEQAVAALRDALEGALGAGLSEAAMGALCKEVRAAMSQDEEGERPSDLSLWARSSEPARELLRSFLCEVDARAINQGLDQGVPSKPPRL